MTPQAVELVVAGHGLLRVFVVLVLRDDDMQGKERLARPRRAVGRSAPPVARGVALIDG